MSIGIVTIVLIATLVLLITEKLPVDLTAIGIAVVLILTGILTPLEAVSGFASPAVITVAAMFMVSQGLIRTGAVGFIGQKVIALSRGNSKLAMLVILLIVGVSSAFINNTPVVVLFIPIVLSLSCELSFSPSKFLIPVSYASILAGTSTLIGTSTNIIVSDYSASRGYGALGMFELTALGVPIALLGIVFLLFAAPLLMPSHRSPVCELKEGGRRRYLAEFHIPRESPLIGQKADRVFADRHPSLEVLELIRYSHIYYPERDAVVIAPDDLLLVKGTANELLDILHTKGVELPLADKDLVLGSGENASMLIELIIPPQSMLVGARLIESQLQRDPDVHILAIQRSGLHYTEKNVPDIRLRNGDILLIWCTESKLGKLRLETDLIVVEDVHHEIVHKRKARMAFMIFSGLVTAAAAGVADIMVCALTAVLLMIATGCLQLRDAYRTLQANVLLLIVGTIALGKAMEKTGASQYYAEAFLALFTDSEPVMVLAGVILLTSISTHLLSNNATAILMLPIAISSAETLGVDPKAFIVAVCFGASACFATPIGYQTNLLVYGPGGYRFSDYLKLGMPLNLIVLVLGTLLIPFFWPL
ncbi:MAG: SLC13 family permease [Deltaproteobacteria bacterium]|nr:SLC13 family permease [Deltaproteobacteria bacterium]